MERIFVSSPSLVGVAVQVDLHLVAGLRVVDDEVGAGHGDALVPGRILRIEVEEEHEVFRCLPYPHLVRDLLQGLVVQECSRDDVLRHVASVGPVTAVEILVEVGIDGGVPQAEGEVGEIHQFVSHVGHRQLYLQEIAAQLPRARGERGRVAVVPDRRDHGDISAREIYRLDEIGRSAAARAGGGVGGLFFLFFLFLHLLARRLGRRNFRAGLRIRERLPGGAGRKFGGARGLRRRTAPAGDRRQGYDGRQDENRDKREYPSDLPLVRSHHPLLLVFFLQR
ncbi:MAG: hypothetical protein C4536_15290 [Actinobacteria bacterium]|nr:MAG: hypothetical protein C4536_15290 [Actinomycetota bacterium]